MALALLIDLRMIPKVLGALPVPALTPLAAMRDHRDAKGRMTDLFFGGPAAPLFADRSL
ncbi:MAG: hypothetical protein AAF367_06965 [Pseudomonadota bacterium]